VTVWLWGQICHFLPSSFISDGRGMGTDVEKTEAQAVDKRLLGSRAIPLPALHLYPYYTRENWPTFLLSLYT